MEPEYDTLSGAVGLADGSTVTATGAGIRKRLTPNTWHYVVLTADGTELNLYADGAPYETATYSGTLKTGFVPVGIGASPADGGGVSGAYW